jgi:DNA helicase-2/ATP-dependent DNA helicase PcrA
MSILEGLNPNQLRAVTTPAESVLVVAGAGSGKTKTLTTRIAYLIQEKGVSPYNILALTFTRKAAAEMKERLEKMLGKMADKLSIGTFHSISLRMLQTSGSVLGYSKNITVYDEIDQLDILTSIVTELGLKVKPKDVVRELQGYASDCDKHEFEAEIAMIVTEYRHKLKSYNAVDFTLLLTETLDMLRNYVGVFQYWHDRFKHVFVDEYQDTDRTQFYLHEAIKPQSIFVVGDMDQSIYGWRGSDIAIIRDFEKRDGAEVVKLEQSYRCPENVVDMANNLISYNTERFDKKLWTLNDGGAYRFSYEEDQELEARGIAEIVQSLERYKETTVLTRKHSQHAVIAKEFEKAGIPYKLVGQRINFWKTQGARMVISVLKVLHNYKDDWNFKRIARDILYKNFTEADWVNIEMSALQAKVRPITLLLQGHKSPFNGVVEWYTTIGCYQVLPHVVNKIMSELPIAEYFLHRGLTTKAQEYGAVFQECVAWMDKHPEACNVPDFLEWLADQDIQSEIDNEDVVKIATIHAVKGLEFPVVFLAGLNEDVLPHKRGDIEEERRLCYVAITRTMERLYLSSHALNERQHNMKLSRFVEEMQDANTIHVTGADKNAQE